METALISVLKAKLNPSIYEFGFADLSGLLSDKYKSYTHGVSILRKLDDSIIDSIRNSPTIDYYNHYREINHELNGMVVAIASQLKSNSYSFLPIKATVDDDELDEAYHKTLTYNFSHKMAATRAGLGWIGKTDLLVSHRFGPRIRLASILTDCPLKITTRPIEASLCGKCSICADNCPGKVSTGLLWNIHVPRNQFYDPFKCREYCRKISKEAIDKDMSLCGKCVCICPKGRRENGI